MPYALCLKAMLTQYQLSSRLSSSRKFTTDSRSREGGCMAVEDSFELASLLCTSQAGGDTVPSLLRQFEGSRTQRVTRVFNSSRQIGKLAQVNTAIGCLLRNGIYKLTPTRFADLQFKWLFDYQPQWNQTRTNHSESEERRV